MLDNSDGTVDLPVSEISIVRRLDRAGEGELPPQRGALPADRRDRGAVGHRPRQGDALGRLPGPRRGDRHLQAARPPAADRGGRRAGQAPQAPPPRAAQARAHPGQPRPRARRRARGALAPAAAQAPGRSGRAARAPASARRSRRAGSWPGTRSRACRLELAAAEAEVAEARAARGEIEASACRRSSSAARRAERALSERAERHDAALQARLRGALGRERLGLRGEQDSPQGRRCAADRAHRGASSPSWTVAEHAAGRGTAARADAGAAHRRRSMQSWPS